MRQVCPICSKPIDDPKHPRRKYCSRQCYIERSRLRIGLKVGRLTVVQFLECDLNGALWYLCYCDCGATVKRRKSHLSRPDGQNQSCGCLTGESHVTHGHSRRGEMSAEYRAYSGAKQRCTNPSIPGFPDYGGRGIEFRFKSFLDWLSELGTKPSSAHSVDRIDVDGHYEPGNVRWATREQQANNTRRAKRMPP